MNIFKNTGISCFAVQHEALNRIRRHGKAKLKQSALKLYLLLCKQSSKPVVEADATAVEKQIGLSKNAVPRARTELRRLGLITAEMQPGQGATYVYAVLNPGNGEPFHPKDNAAPYFQVPTISLFNTGLMLDNKASSLVYASVLAEANRLSTPHLNLSPKKLAALASISSETLRNVSRVLTDGDIPLIKVADNKVEVLDPYTGRSLNDAAGQNEEALWYANSDGKRVRVNELLTLENFITYYTSELPDLVPGLAQQDVKCIFHSDSVPSMSVNLEEGTWFCHACGVGGGIRDFEMRKLDTDSKTEAWRAICTRFGVRFFGKHRGAMTSQHIYRDEDGHPVSRLRRYEDGSGRWYYFVGGKWKVGLGGRKRIPYNLPDVRQANVVIITEGEKKADWVGFLGLFDVNRKPVAVTCTGSANSWKPELVEYFRGKKVLVFRDSDAPGHRYAESVTGSLRHAGIPCQVVDFAEYGNDVRDFLNVHGSAEDLANHVDSEWLEERASESVVDIAHDLI